jgi:hypothetical protein
MAYVHGPLMFALDRRIFDTPLEERLQARTSDLAWTTTMSPVIHHSISGARAQIRTGHHDIRTYFDSGRINHERDAKRLRQHRPLPQSVSNSRLLAVQQ